MNIAILSNSYGEDRSGAIIGEEIKKLCPNASVIGVPLISLGEEYKKRGIDVLFSSPPPPSGGFLLESPVGFVNDLVTSSRVPFSYIARLRRMRDKIDRVIVVGDIMLLLLGWFAFRKRMWFLAPCKSDYFSPHLGIEKKIMKRTTIEIFTHDELTANNLQHCGISAIFLGNPMMDELEKENLYNPPEDKSLIGILPGSRKEAYENKQKNNKQSNTNNHNNKTIENQNHNIKSNNNDHNIKKKEKPVKEVTNTVEKVKKKKETPKTEKADEEVEVKMIGKKRQK